MKKIAFLILFALLSTAGFSQLKLRATDHGNKISIEIPSGLLIEYSVHKVDPINPGKVEVKKGVFDDSHVAKTLAWESDSRLQYELTYRFQTAAGELSEWITVDPRSLVPNTDEGK